MLNFLSMKLLREIPLNDFCKLTVFLQDWIHEIAANGEAFKKQD